MNVLEGCAADMLRRELLTDGARELKERERDAKELGIDPNRVAAGGGSAGGHVAAAVAVRGAVAALPQRQREAVVARYFADLSIAETAKAMRCAPGTVQALTPQAIANLRRAGLDIDTEEEAMAMIVRR